MLSEESAIAQGYQVFKGKVHVCSGEELIKLQKVDIDPAVAGGVGTYAVLVFDHAVDVTGMYADGSGENTRTANMLGIAEYSDYGSFVVEYGSIDLCKELEGQKQVTIIAKAEDITFPSDVRLPINEPTARDILVLS